MEWKSFVYGIITALVLLLAMASFGYAHIGSLSVNGNVVSGSVSGDIPEKCQVPAGQDLEGWVEHLGHHAETRECLQYFE